MIPMKTSLLVFSLLSLALVGCSKKDDTATLADKTKAAAENAADQTKATAVEVRDAIGDKLVEWKLTPADIKADLEKGGRVVRSKAVAAGNAAGTMVDNARIVTVINAKYVGESDLSALKINVSADQGTVTLTGTATTHALIGKAVYLALDTDGVTQVVSLLTVEVK